MDRIEQPQAAARRGFFARIAGAAAIGLSGIAGRRADAAEAIPDSWPGALKGRYRQVTDAYNVNGGFPLYYTLAFLKPNPPGSATGVVILRSAAMPLGLNHAMWEKYRIGATLDVIDPETRAPAVKNPFLTPKPGVLHTDAAALNVMVAKGVIFGVCDQALHGLSAMMGAKIGIEPAAAAKEWTANVIPGMTLLPSGVWGLNRAQLAGCTYCSGG